MDKEMDRWMRRLCGYDEELVSFGACNYDDGY